MSSVPATSTTPTVTPAQLQPTVPTTTAMMGTTPVTVTAGTPHVQEANGTLAGLQGDPHTPSDDGSNGNADVVTDTSDTDQAVQEPDATSNNKTFGKWIIRIIFTPVMFVFGAGKGFYCGLILGLGVPMIACIKSLYESTDSWLLAVVVFPVIAFAVVFSSAVGSVVGVFCGAIIFSAATATLDTKPLKYADDQIRVMFCTLIWGNTQEASEPPEEPTSALPGSSTPHLLPDSPGEDSEAQAPETVAPGSNILAPPGTPETTADA